MFPYILYASYSCILHLDHILECAVCYSHPAEDAGHSYCFYNHLVDVADNHLLHLGYNVGDSHPLDVTDSYLLDCNEDGNHLLADVADSRLPVGEAGIHLPADVVDNHLRGVADNRLVGVTDIHPADVAGNLLRGVVDNLPADETDSRQNYNEGDSLLGDPPGC